MDQESYNSSCEKDSINYDTIHEDIAKSFRVDSSINGSTVEVNTLYNRYTEPFKAIRINKMQINNIGAKKKSKTPKPNFKPHQKYRSSKSEERRPKFNLKSQKEKLTNTFYRTILDPNSSFPQNPKLHTLKPTNPLSSFNQTTKHKVSKDLQKALNLKVDYQAKAVGLNKTSAMKYNLVRQFLETRAVGELYTFHEDWKGRRKDLDVNNMMRQSSPTGSPKNASQLHTYSIPETCSKPKSAVKTSSTKPLAKKSLQVISRSIYSNKQPERAISQDHTKKARMIRRMQQEKAAQEHLKIIERSNRPYMKKMNQLYYENLNKSVYGLEHQNNFSTGRSWNTRAKSKSYYGKPWGNQMIKKKTIEFSDQQKPISKKHKPSFSKKIDLFTNSDLKDLDMLDPQYYPPPEQDPPFYNSELLGNVLDTLNESRKSPKRDVPSLSGINISNLKKQLQDLPSGQKKKRTLEVESNQRPATSHERFSKLLKHHVKHYKKVKIPSPPTPHPPFLPPNPKTPHPLLPPPKP
ncbi:unnamed protein product [Moneuplotes crassus]|uniref:Uncharacterized protein n=1 Tax=Euplotes crassus TaxID=5936 RepID=A0AAD1Y426_EUPCR|nr:unnamed protein product [Moneuplotes crassus]